LPSISNIFDFIDVTLLNLPLERIYIPVERTMNDWDYFSDKDEPKVAVIRGHTAEKVSGPQSCLKRKIKRKDRGCFSISEFK
jgi:hypothetical protein